MSAKTVLITGATSGIGLALFHEYVNRGYKVIACGRNLEVLNLLKSKATQVFQFDVNNADDVINTLSSISNIDIVILNAGTCHYIDDAINFSAEIFADVVTTNLISIGNLLQALLPKVPEGGQLVFVSSSATILPFPKSEAYGASKAGLDYLAKSLRIDLALHNIDVSLIHPGFIKTPLTDKNEFSMPFLMHSDEAAQRIIKAISARKHYYHFPKRLTWILKFFSILPDAVWQSLILRKSH